MLLESFSIPKKLTFFQNFLILGVPHHPEHCHVAGAVGTRSHPEVLRSAHTQVGRTLQGQRGSPQESPVKRQQHKSQLKTI